jgi:hypothetical protein
MINTNEAILDELTDSEYFLLSIFASYGKISHPSNDVLVSRSKWDLKKVKKYRKQLIDKGFLTSEPRYQIVEGRTRRASNKYEITTGLMKKFNGKNKKSEIVNIEVGNLRKQIKDLKKQIASLENAKPTEINEIEIKKPVDEPKEKPKKKPRKKPKKANIEDLEFKEDFGDDLKEFFFDYIKHKKKSYTEQWRLQKQANYFYESAKTYGIAAVYVALETTHRIGYDGIFIKGISKQQLEAYEKQAGKTNGTNYGSAEQSDSLQDQFNNRFGGSGVASSSSNEDSDLIQEFD